MAGHEYKPLPYEARILDTKGVAQRLDLDYLKRPSLFRDLRRKLTWIAPVAAAFAIAPFVLGIGKTTRVFSRGPVSQAHAMFENNCAICHTRAFSIVANQACQQCHDGPSHPAKPVDTGKLISEPRCTACHVEHRGAALAEVNDGNCTACHSALTEHGTGVKLRATKITAFREGRHPDFPAAGITDTRPLRLNHALHMPAQPKAIRGMKLPLQCVDCHTTSLGSKGGDLEPVTFDKHCRTCHQRELEFVLPGLPVEARPAPHTKDAPAIRQFIRDTYQKLVEANPSLIGQLLGRDLAAAPNAGAWVAQASARSEEYLFQNKCRYCHEYAGMNGDFPVVKKVNQVRGRYVETRPEGDPWLARGEFSHRAHRAVACESCHTAARSSSKTSDVLIPGIKRCAPCHGAGSARIDRCSECHLYHNKLQERDRDRRPIEQLIRSSL
jgi:hypothetical protein